MTRRTPRGGRRSLGTPARSLRSTNATEPTWRPQRVLHLVDDYWDEARDATLYAGPNPIVAHPPCKRWGRFWSADGSTEPGHDGGLFLSALDSLRRWGGVLEHPEASHAWAHFEIPRPSVGTWTRSRGNEWTTCVAQRNYGHKARKLTWLLCCGETEPPPLDWSKPEPPEAYLCPPGRRGPHAPGDTSVKRLTPRENELTPLPFAELLVSIALAAPERG